MPQVPKCSNATYVHNSEFLSHNIVWFMYMITGLNELFSIHFKEDSFKIILRYHMAGLQLYIN